MSAVMPATLTPERIAAMREGKRKHDELRRKAYRKAQTAFVAWVRAESAAFALKQRIDEEFGRESPEYADAHLAWRALWQAMPTPPPDSAWVREV